MLEIESIKSDLEKQFPEYSFRLGKRIYGQCIIATNTKYSGADIFVKPNSIIVEASVPDTKTRLLIGAGAALFKMFSKSYSEPSVRIKEFLSKKYDSVSLRQ